MIKTDDFFLPEAVLVALAALIGVATMVEARIHPFKLFLLLLGFSSFSGIVVFATFYLIPAEHHIPMVQRF